MSKLKYEVEWDPVFICISLIVSFIGALTAVQLSEQRRRSLVLGKTAETEVYLVLMAVAIGVVAIWAMHFTGMMAMTVKHPITKKSVEVTYDAGWTVFSAFAALLCVYCGLRIAMKDKFFSSLDTTATLAADMAGKSLGDMRKASTVKLSAFVTGIHWLVLGGVITAGGVGAMHFTGMVSQHFGQTTEWDYGIVTGAMVIAIVAASAAFWIIFRFLAWKPNLEMFRIAAAVIMSIAVNGMHYSGMMAATYYVDPKAKEAQITPETALGLAAFLTVCLTVSCYNYMIRDLRSTVDNAGANKPAEQLSQVVVSVKGSGAMNLATMISKPSSKVGPMNLAK